MNNNQELNKLDQEIEESVNDFIEESNKQKNTTKRKKIFTFISILSLWSITITGIILPVLILSNNKIAFPLSTSDETIGFEQQRNSATITASTNANTEDLDLEAIIWECTDESGNKITEQSTPVSFKVDDEKHEVATLTWNEAKTPKDTYTITAAIDRKAISSIDINVVEYTGLWDTLLKYSNQNYLCSGFVGGHTPTKDQINLALDENEGKMVFKSDTTMISEQAFISKNNVFESSFPANSKEIILSLPPNLETIGYGAFGSCPKLKSIDMSSCTKEISISSSAFFNCNSLETADLSNVSLIASDAFAGCVALESVAFSSSLTNINITAFLNCQINDVTVQGDCQISASYSGNGFLNKGTINATGLNLGQVQKWATALGLGEVKEPSTGVFSWDKAA